MDEDKKIWRNYGILGILIIIYTVIGNPRGNMVRNLWFGYIMLAAILGYMYR